MLLQLLSRLNIYFLPLLQYLIGISQDQMVVMFLQVSVDLIKTIYYCTILLAVGFAAAPTSLFKS